MLLRSENLCCSRPLCSLSCVIPSERGQTSLQSDSPFSPLPSFVPRPLSAFSPSLCCENRAPPDGPDWLPLLLAGPDGKSRDCLWMVFNPVQGGWGGWPTGNGKKLSNSQACCLAQLCLAAAKFLSISCGPSTHPPCTFPSFTGNGRIGQMRRTSCSVNYSITCAKPFAATRYIYLICVLLLVSVLPNLPSRYVPPLAVTMKVKWCLQDIPLSLTVWRANWER